MSNPRDTISHDNIRTSAETYEHDNTIVFDADEENGSAQVGLACTLRSDGTVGLVGDGEQVEGRIAKVETGGFCAVENEGNVNLPAGTGASLTPGKGIVGALLSSAEGYIREVATATAAELGRQRGRIKDATDTTAVVVEL